MPVVIYGRESLLSKPHMSTFIVVDIEEGDLLCVCGAVTIECIFETDSNYQEILTNLFTGIIYFVEDGINTKVYSCENNEQLVYKLMINPELSYMIL